MAAELDACGKPASVEMPEEQGHPWNKFDFYMVRDCTMAARLANASGVVAKYERGAVTVKMQFGPPDAELEKELSELRLTHVGMQRAAESGRSTGGQSGCLSEEGEGA